MKEGELHDDELRTKLLSYRIRREDAEAAVTLRRFLRTIDDSVVRKPIEIIISARSRKVSMGVFALYSPASSDNVAHERYVLFVDGLVDAVRRHIGTLAKETGLADVCLQDALASIAAHEVRHRVQERKLDLRLFEPCCPCCECTCRESRDSVRTRVLRARCAAFSARERELKGSAVEDEFSWQQVSAREFDAQVVDRLALYELREGVRMENLAPIITIEPELPEK